MKYVIAYGWLCEEVDGCTCGGGVPYGHEIYCGLEPLTPLNKIVGWKEELEALHKEWAANG